MSIELQAVQVTRRWKRTGETNTMCLSAAVENIVGNVEGSKRHEIKDRLMLGETLETKNATFRRSVSGIL